MANLGSAQPRKPTSLSKPKWKPAMAEASVQRKSLSFGPMSARVRIGYFCWSKQEESDGGHSEAESVA